MIRVYIRRIPVSYTTAPAVITRHNCWRRRRRRRRRIRPLPLSPFRLTNAICATATVHAVWNPTQAQFHRRIPNPPPKKPYFFDGAMEGSNLSWILCDGMPILSCESSYETGPWRHMLHIFWQGEERGEDRGGASLTCTQSFPVQSFEIKKEPEK